MATAKQNFEDSAVIRLQDLTAWPGDAEHYPAFADESSVMTAAVEWDESTGELEVELLNQVGQPIDACRLDSVEREPGRVSFAGKGASSAMYLRVTNGGEHPVVYQAEIRARGERDE